MTGRRALFTEDFGPHAAAVEALADTLATTAAARDAVGGSALAERDLLRASGLLPLAVPVALGGAGAPWPLLLAMVRRLAAADSSMAHLFGFQHLQVATVLLFGSPAQQRRYLTATVRDGWFWGNAVNTRDARLLARRSGDGWRLHGVKSFCSGAKGSDALVVSAVTKQGERLYFVLPTARAGIDVNDDWDSMGQRQTDSGSVAFREVDASAAECLGSPPATPRASLRSLVSQSVLAAIYLGNAEGALAEAAAYAGTSARPWPVAGVERAVDDPLLQLRAGEMWAGLRAARALAREAADGLQAAWEEGDGLGGAQRAALSLLVGAARVTAGRTALDVTSRIFELTGARSTATQLRLDRYWRNVRVHTLHDPLDWRAKEAGRWVLAGEAPVGSAYG